MKASKSGLFYLYIFTKLPYQAKTFSVPAATPGKTFIEKMCLKHEKVVLKEIKRPDVERQSRHLYDLVSMTDHGILDQVLQNKNLYDTIIEHRKNWIRMKGIDYDRLRPKSITFTPTDDLLEYFREDYSKMQSIMIYGDSPSFDKIIEKISDINERIKYIYG